MSVRWTLRVLGDVIVMTKKKNRKEWLIGDSVDVAASRAAIAERLTPGDCLLDVDQREYFTLSQEPRSRRN